MGEAAVVMQEYLGDAYRFADLFNVVFFQGEQVIEPQMLSEQSERYAVHPPKPQGHPGGRRGDRRKRPGNGKHREEYRDVKKTVPCSGYWRWRRKAMWTIQCLCAAWNMMYRNI